MPPAEPTRDRRGRLFVIAAPSGAGKTSLVNALLERKPELRVSISHTTRAKRPTEENGREYYFVTQEEFARLRDEGAFLESAQVFGNFYATGRETVERLRNAGTDVILEIDWQGAQQVRKAMPDAQTIFILPPSRIALEQRLRDRNTDSEEVIQRRLRDAEGDMSHWKEFDYVVVNDDFERAVADLVAIVEGRGDRLRSRRPELASLLSGLLGAKG
ncbi:MAG TPA: guanylate kinase [Steroidobacteraceae bacterium]|nr:guanylate kinase [Steroidobacteraceae bacterium]